MALNTATIRFDYPQVYAALAAANQRLSEDNGAARAARRQEKAAHESGPAVRKKSARQVNTN